MPLVPFEAALAGRRQTLPAQTQALDREQPESNVTGLDVMASALRQNNIASNAPQMISDAVDSFDDVYDPKYDPLADSEVAGYEHHAERFINSRSRAETQRIKNRIGIEAADKKVIQEAGWAGMAASIGAGFMDPVTLASMATPVGAGTRAVKIAKMVGTSVLLDSAQELALHAQQELRTLDESVINVGAGALLTGGLGTLATRVPKSEFDAMRRAADEHTAGLGPAPADGIESTGGAARVGFGTTLDDETVAPGGAALLKSVGKISPLGRVMQSASKRARIVMQELADVPFLLNKHLKGIATPRSAEGEIKAAQADRYRLVRETDAAWREHRTAGGSMSRGEFSEAVASSLRRGEQSPDAAVARVAQSYRKYFDDSRKELQENDLLPDPVKADQQRLEEQAVGKYVKAESAQIYSNYQARNNVHSSSFRRMVRDELDERAKPASERAAVSAAPEPVRAFADALEQSKAARGDIDAQLEVKLSTIEQAKQIGIEKAEAAADLARRTYAESRAAIGRTGPKAREPEALREPQAVENTEQVPDSVKTDDAAEGDGYSVQEGELTDEQLAAFKGLRSDVQAQEVVGGSGARASERAGHQGDGGSGGEPHRVFRGASRELTADDFNPEALGHSTGHPSSALGVFFTNAGEDAAKYGNVSEHFLDIRNPKRFKIEDFPGLDTPDEYRALAQRLKAEGHDGIIIDASEMDGPVNYVAFDHAQVVKAPTKAAAPKPRADVMPKPMTRERRTIEAMKLRETRDKELRAARKQREAEVRAAEKAAAAARAEAKAAGGKVRAGAQDARGKALKKLQSVGAIDEKAFLKRAEKAARTGEDDVLEEVNQLAKLLRRQELGDLSHLVAVPKTRATQKPLGAESYLPRMWDHSKIRATRSEFEDALRDWFSRQSDIAPEELDTAVADVIDTVNGSLRDHAQIATGFVGKTGSLKSRVLNVPDTVLEPWLVNDVEKIMENYIRNVTPQLVLKRKFGDLDLRQQMQDVRDEYNAMRERVDSNEAKAKLTDEMEATLADLQSVRDLMLGKFGRPANPDSFLVRTGRVLRTWNYIRSLGGQLFSSLPDAGRLVARHGLVRTASTISRLVANSGMRKLAKDEAHRMGTALEYVLNTRAETLGEIGDELVSSRLDRFLRRESNRFSRITGMASWNSALKTVAVALEQDAIVRAARGGELSKFQRGQLANLGIGDRMAERIGEQMNKHGTDIEGLLRSNSELWTDQEAAHAFEGALLKSADQVVLTKGAADVPLFMNKDLGRTLLQFRSFGMASVNRLLIPMAQGVRHGDLATLNGAWMMMALGALANAARDYSAGYKPETDPTRVAVEAFDRAGFTAFLSEPIDLLSGTFGGPRFGRFSSTTPEEQLVGPAVGAAIDVQQTLQKAFTNKGDFDPGLDAKDIYRFRKLLPYQNFFLTRRLVNMLEGEFAEGIGAEGAGTKSAVDRLTESRELNR